MKIINPTLIIITEEYHFRHDKVNALSLIKIDILNRKS